MHLANYEKPGSLKIKDTKIKKIELTFFHHTLILFSGNYTLSSTVKTLEVG